MNWAKSFNNTVMCEKKMDTIITGDIWKQVRPYAKAAKRRLVAVAYVTTESHLGFRKNDVLVCDASDRAIKGGETSARLLQLLHQKGVELRSRPDLHAKVAVLGGHALIGSCNLSTASAGYLTELAFLSDRKQIVSQAAAFVHTLRETSEEIDDTFLQRVLKLKVCTARRQGSKRRGKTTRFGGKVWSVSVRQLAEDSFPKEQSFVEKAEQKAAALVADEDSAISWIRFTGKSPFRATARPGDLVIQIQKSPSGKRVTAVDSPIPILYRQDIAHWTRLYVSDSEDCESLSWERFKKAAKKAGLSRISRNSERELSPREVFLAEDLWK
jgi:hypothetical protein